jgi:hypothetical protein
LGKKAQKTSEKASKEAQNGLKTGHFLEALLPFNTLQCALSSLFSAPPY